MKILNAYRSQMVPMMLSNVFKSFMSLIFLINLGCELRASDLLDTEDQQGVY